MIKLAKTPIHKKTQYVYFLATMAEMKDYLMNLLINNSFSVSEAPTQLAVSSRTATSFCITISPPVNNTQNGLIQSYTVSYQGELFNTTQVNVSVSVVVIYPLTASSSLCINGLEEFNNYTVSVRAINGAEEGAAITRVFRTLESGLYLLIIMDVSVLVNKIWYK